MSRSLTGLTKVSLVMLIGITILQDTLSEQRICGAAINEVMTLMCKYGTKPLDVKRNSMLDGDLEDNNNEDNFAFSFDMIPHWGSMEANTLAKIRRRREGIYHECCLKSCTKSEIMSYCRPAK
ncbi:probable insulin-like peptide 3 [Episyrphus balteatus]|uniref:probable insulin-like peptide 3 n=1 Tax=Episyrphus balteatus TaxID=286459 RepID=UPI0024853E01|nr:probable insulin-like peptide 3 [Episyrphus balteatus]